MTSTMTRTLAIAALLLSSGCVEELAVATETDELVADPQELVVVDVVTRASELGDLWIDIADPVDGEEVDAGFWVYVAAGPASTIESVELYVDDELAGTRTTSPYRFQTDPYLGSGPHALQAFGTDGTGVVDQAITVTVAGTDPDPDPDPEPDPDPDPDPAPDPDPDPGPDPGPEPGPVGGVPGACHVVGGGSGAPELLILLAFLGLRRRR